MSGLLFTIIAAAVLIALAIIGLAISLILTGKSTFTRFTCGWNPNQKKNEKCGTTTTCPLCKPEEEKQKKKKEEDNEDDDD